MKYGVCLALALVACSEKPDPKDASDPIEAPTDGPASRPKSSGPAIQSEIGALDEGKVDEVLSNVRRKVARCLSSANKGMDLEVVGGDIEVLIRVKTDGSTRWVVPVRSTLGDRKAEECIMNVLMVQDWPAPEGGDEGLVRTEYGIDPPGRAPTAWRASDLGSKGSEVKQKLRSCKSDAGATSLSITMYVDADGNVMRAGGAVGDDRGPEAIACGIDAVQGMTFPSPGSYPAKVTVSVR